uniref:Reverse transcriptase Ty1/copia-type domain-containing protein n=1 Tax=Fagus sylvatica TaxID=28930 RepID=A0A2N9I6G4_FAGSY
MDSIVVKRVVEPQGDWNSRDTFKRVKVSSSALTIPTTATESSPRTATSHFTCSQARDSRPVGTKLQSLLGSLGFAGDQLGFFSGFDLSFPCTTWTHGDHLDLLVLVLLHTASLHGGSRLLSSLTPPIFPDGSWFPFKSPRIANPPPWLSVSSRHLSVSWISLVFSDLSWWFLKQLYSFDLYSTCSMCSLGNTCLHSSSSPSWVIDSGASDHMTVSSIVVPKSYREALSHPGISIVGCRWVFTVKQNPDGTVDRLKARLVAKGFTQTYGLDYIESFSPVAKLNSICIIISLAANLDWPLHQLDVKNAFLHGDLTEAIYMAQSPGFESKGGVQADHFVFFKKTKTGIVILVVYVDDIVITWSDKEGIQILINHLSSSFLTKDLVKLRYFLGIEVARSKSGISLSQRKYTFNILQDIGYLGSKPIATPMESNMKLMPEEGDFVDDLKTYRRLVGKLIYLTITRPDISYAVSIVSQFMTSPRVPHMNAVIRILKGHGGAGPSGLHFGDSDEEDGERMDDDDIGDLDDSDDRDMVNYEDHRDDVISGEENIETGAGDEGNTQVNGDDDLNGSGVRDMEVASPPRDLST